MEADEQGQSSVDTGPFGRIGRFLHLLGRGPKRRQERQQLDEAPDEIRRARNRKAEDALFEEDLVEAAMAANRRLNDNNQHHCRQNQYQGGLGARPRTRLGRAVGRLKVLTKEKCSPAQGSSSFHRMVPKESPSMSSGCVCVRFSRLGSSPDHHRDDEGFARGQQSASTTSKPKETRKGKASSQRHHDGGDVDHDQGDRRHQPADVVGKNCRCRHHHDDHRLTARPVTKRPPDDHNPRPEGPAVALRSGSPGSTFCRKSSFARKASPAREGGPASVSKDLTDRRLDDEDDDDGSDEDGVGLRLIDPTSKPAELCLLAEKTLAVMAADRMTAAPSSSSPTSRRESSSSAGSASSSSSSSSSSSASSCAGSSRITSYTQIDYTNFLVPGQRVIVNCPFYWGKIDRYEAESLLADKPEGSFLLRDSAQDDFVFSVSFRRYNRSLHARIEEEGHLFSFDSHDPGVHRGPSVVGLLDFYKDPLSCMFFEPMLLSPVVRKVCFSLQTLARAAICDRTTYTGISELPIPPVLKRYLREYHYKHKLRIRFIEEHHQRSGGSSATVAPAPVAAAAASASACTSSSGHHRGAARGCLIGCRGSKNGRSSCRKNNRGSFR